MDAVADIPPVQIMGGRQHAHGPAFAATNAVNQGIGPVAHLFSHFQYLGFGGVGRPLAATKDEGHGGPGDAQGLGDRTLIEALRLAGRFFLQGGPLYI